MSNSKLPLLPSLILLAAIAGCSSKTSLPNDKGDSVAATAPVSASGGQVAFDTAGMARMGGADNVTGDADHDFLRMMTDHHSGLIALAHPTIEAKEKLAVKDDARKMDKAQDAEIKTMIGMLKRLYSDSYTPKVTPDNKRMVDELRSKSGNDYSRTFLQDVIAHHQQAIKMIDEYMPNGKNAALKTMAAKMKVDQTKEIAELEMQLNTLK